MALPVVTNPLAVYGFYRQLLYAPGAASTSAAAGTKYVCRGATDQTSIGTGTTQPTFFLLAAADLAVAGLTTKLRVVAVVKTATAPAVTITVGLYPVSAAASDTLGTVVTGSTVALPLPAANSDASANSGDFDLPADGLYAFGYTVSGTPSGGFAVHPVLQVRNV